MATKDPIRSGIALLLGAAGITGALVAAGYVVRVGQGDLLGVSTYDPERAGYFLAAGDLILHTFLLLLGWRTLLALLIASMLIVMLTFITSHYVGSRIIHNFLILFLILSCATHLTFFVLPIVPIKNALIDTVCTDRYAEVSRVIKWRTDEIWRDMVCSRTSSVHSCGTQAPGVYREALDHSYLAALLLGLILCAVGVWTILWDFSRTSHATFQTTFYSEWFRALLALALFSVVIGIAYQYGKTEQSTAFPRVKIIFAKDVMDQQIANVSFSVISETDQNTVLFDPDSDVLWLVRNSAINIEKTNELPDVLGSRIEHYAKTCQ